MDRELLSCVEIEPESPAERSVIWLHGLGADGRDFEPIVPYLGLDPALAVRFVFPHAPRIPVTLNMGMVMPAWYDIRTPDLQRDLDLDGLRRSAEAVRRLLEREAARGVPPGRVVLAGFSQGAAVALYLGLRYPETLAGILALSTYLAGEETLDTEASEANRATPIFQAHGTFDPMVPMERGRAAHDRLTALGYDTRWRTYPMEHQVNAEEIDDVGRWLGEVFARVPRAGSPPAEKRNPGAPDA
jgi:phospholipase/carboxylesterase